MVDKVAIGDRRLRVLVASEGEIRAVDRARDRWRGLPRQDTGLDTPEIDEGYPRETAGLREGRAAAIDRG